MISCRVFLFWKCHYFCFSKVFPLKTYCNRKLLKQIPDWEIGPYSCLHPLPDREIGLRSCLHQPPDLEIRPYSCLHLPPDLEIRPHSCLYPSPSRGAPQNTFLVFFRYLSGSFKNIFNVLLFI